MPIGDLLPRKISLASVWDEDRQLGGFCLNLVGK